MYFTPKCTEYEVRKNLVASLPFMIPNLHNPLWRTTGFKLKANRIQSSYHLLQFDDITRCYDAIVLDVHMPSRSEEPNRGFAGVRCPECSDRKSIFRYEGFCLLQRCEMKCLSFLHCRTVVQPHCRRCLSHADTLKFYGGTRWSTILASASYHIDGLMPSRYATSSMQEAGVALSN